ncbi:MAG: sulfotransferase family 2 domain-containing protein [Cyanobacteria bacterium P01_A01_bin.123]
MKISIKSIFKRVEEKYACFHILRHGFWFIDIPRTSSSSIRAELGTHFGFPYGKINLTDKQYASRQIFPDHMPAEKIHAILGESVWRKIFTFTIVRNPWDRIHSLYEYRRKVRRIPQELSFRDYVLSLEKAVSNNDFSNTLFQHPYHRYGASEFISGKNGEVMVDYIAKYENREYDLKPIATRLNLPQLGGLNIQRASSGSKNYSYFYDSEMRECIEKIYAKDIELFDYRFDDGAS